LKPAKFFRKLDKNIVIIRCRSNSSIRAVGQNNTDDTQADEQAEDLKSLLQQLGLTGGDGSPADEVPAEDPAIATEGDDPDAARPEESAA
jgi:hypothetical protein